MQYEYLIGQDPVLSIAMECTNPAQPALHALRKLKGNEKGQLEDGLLHGVM